MVSTIKKIEINFEFEMENEHLSNLLFKTLDLESSYNPNERATASLDLRDNTLLLHINAQDSVSARAAINSFLKWINLSLQSGQNTMQSASVTRTETMVPRMTCERVCALSCSLAHPTSVTKTVQITSAITDTIGPIWP